MNDLYLELHHLFNSKKRFRLPFDEKQNPLPSNGIYIMFEKGEKYKTYDRIVRVGTHTGDGQLRSRLNQHFLKENKNRSIFRKNIGRCFLNKEEHPYINIWELDTTSKAEKERHLRLLDLDFEKQLEKKITKYIQENFSFYVFKVDVQSDRIFWERKIVSTLANYDRIKPSKSWLGYYSPKEKIKKSGLWQVNELYREPLNTTEFERLKNLL